MRNKSRYCGLGLAAAIAWLPACGNGDGGVSGSVVDLAQEYCNIAFRCCIRGEVDYYLGPFVSEENCVERLRNSAELATATWLNLPFGEGVLVVPNVAVLERAVEDGRVEIDEDALAACLDYMSALPCNAYEEPEEVEGCVRPEPPVETPCDHELIFLGKVEEGGSCSSPNTTLECVEGLACRAVDSLGVDGVCVAPGLVGDLCFDDVECDEELYCSLLDGTCQVPRIEGETCMYSVDEGLSPPEWTLLIECDEDLSCDPVTDTCVGPCDRGADCFTDAQCDDTLNLVCIMWRCDEPRAAGAPCEEAEDCLAGLRCAQNPADPAEFICQELLADGESCSTWSDCASGFCDPSDSRCAAASDPGELCPSGSHTQCAGGYCENEYIYCDEHLDCTGSGACNLVYNRCEYYCVATQPDGAICIYSYECESGACIDGYCRTIPLADGEPCSSDFHCESEFCNFEEERVCDTLPMPNGRVCYSPAHCESGVCHDFVCTTGLAEGADCSSALDPPCARELFCDREQSPALCVPVYEAGAECERAEQCRGACTGRFGRYMCDATPAAEAAVCDGL